ncbi:hypothetical protein D5S17_28845 [Pseudonocardiaceae bacterium YIM PH 21723]|nr:hypothetical protein D5S17_28845 [Pseudonocardiaceae bacterium YIM PH 21723]
MTALESWARQQERVPEQRAALLAAAWYAGERTVTELCKASGLSRPTVYADLRSQGIDAATADRAAPPHQPSYRPLNQQQIADLAEHMSVILLPSVIGDKNEKLAEVAWAAMQIIRTIGDLLDPEFNPGYEVKDLRAGLLDTLAGRAETIRRTAHRLWADESTLDKITKWTFWDDMNAAPVDLLPSEATLTVSLPEHGTDMTVRLGIGERLEPEGSTTWTIDAPQPLEAIDGYRHLEIRSLLNNLAEVVRGALHPDLFPPDDH